VSGFESPFAEVAALLLGAALIGGIAVWLRQPLIIAFIVVGVLEGPSFLGWVSAADQVDLLAKIGIALLLFVVGLRLDLRMIRTLGSLALATGAGQMLFSFAAGYLIAIGFGLDAVDAGYVALALAFSSTIIVVKLLSDKREIDALHGRAALGILIVQDVVVLGVILALTALAAGEGEVSLWSAAVAVVVKAAVFVTAIGLAMRYLLPALLHRLATSSELLVLFGIAWAVSLAAAADFMGFSNEVGAFLAGVSLASTPYREAIGARLVSLRDFLLLFFFVDLGAGLDLDLLGAQVGLALALSLLVLVGKPLVVMVLMGAMGYRRRTSFLSGVSLAQISEFSLILGALGLGLGHIGPETMSLITIIGVVTIGVSTYLTLYAHPLYERLEHRLRIFERAIPHPDEDATGAFDPVPPEIVLFGLGRYGGEIARGLIGRGHHVLGIDFDPQLVLACRSEGMNVRYGDAHDPEILPLLPLRQARWVVSTAPEREVNLALLASLRAHGFSGRVAARAHDDFDAEALQRAGADLVLAPFRDAAKEVVDALSAQERAGVPSHPRA